MLKITVAIPAYNAELYLRQALDSVFAQTISPHETVLVNDGSSDRTEEIALSYGDRLRYIKQENRGLAEARNTAIRAATGDWIAFFDSDDVMQPEKLEIQAAAIEADPSLVVVYSAFTILYPNGSTCEIPAFPAKDLWPALRYRSPILPSTSVIRRVSLLAAGGFRSVVTEDWDLWVRLIRSHSAAAFKEVPRSLLLYRSTASGLSKNHRKMATGSLHMLDTAVLSDLSGLPKILWKRRLEAKIYYNLAIALREQGDGRFWAYALQSLLLWPFPGRVVSPYRYLVVANMLYQRMKEPQMSLRYWWPLRACRQELTGKS